MFKALLLGLIGGYVFHFFLRHENAFLLFSMLAGAFVGALYHLNLQVDTLRLQKQKNTRAPGRVERLPAGRVGQKAAGLEEPEPHTAAYAPKPPHSEVAKRDPLVDYLLRYLSGGNPLVRIGAVVLFFGMAFLAKYAADQGLLRIEVRLVGITLFAIALIATGWRLRSRPGQYGLIVQGIGIAMLYLVIFASAKLYGLVPLGTAFVLMLLTVVSGAVLALKQESLPLMIFATGGGFLVPILTSSDSGSHIALFSYYTLLNAGIVMVAWYRSWRVLNVTGFLFTFVIATAWGVLSYEPGLFDTTEPFLILFFLFYLGITILFTSRQPMELKGFIDPTLVFGVPLAAFALQTALVKEIEYALAYSALFMSGVYLFFAKLLWQKKNMRLLAEAFTALSVVFVTLAVPYALDGHWTSATWAVEASAIVWVGLRQKRYYGRLFGTVLQIAAGVLFWSLSFGDRPQSPFFNGIFLGGITVAAAALFTAWLYARHVSVADAEKERYSAALFMGMGLFWWLLAGYRDVGACCDVFANGMLLYIAAGAALFAVAAHLMRWGAMQRVLQGFFVLGLLYWLSLLPHFTAHHPFSGIGFYAFAAFFCVHYLLLYRYESSWFQPGAWHVASLLTAMLIVSIELAWQIDRFTASRTFTHIGYAVAPLLYIALLPQQEKVSCWPIRQHLEAYRKWAVVGLAAALFLWEIKALSLSGDPSPLPFLPLLNPLEAVQAAAAGLLGYWWFRTYRAFGLSSETPKLSVSFFGLAALLLVTVSLARSVHFYAAVRYSVDALWANALFQTALSLLWTAIAFTVILVSKRYGKRPIWIAGATLLGVVIAKLFLVDLSNSATLERIISFSAVGLLVLLIGYIAPLPPKEETAQ